ncbi:hypothetical protein Ddye_013247 [Dipteronia dyeriana]|uniref:HAT C-terminal dimerisation domain-containing protein n=1 Tax=Dipteronia dyeriana TaxID=168575 RepID=A0AAD9X629_9ROSI|nr:hypothetical protein Ddye_013247 [Dipteronia dyeriana]
MLNDEFDISEPTHTQAGLSGFTVTPTSQQCNIPLLYALSVIVDPRVKLYVLEVLLKFIARDVLVIPVSTVSSEQAFSTSERIIEPRRSCLSLEMVDVLTCLRD